MFCFKRLPAAINKVVVGLGNPGTRYARTRHNVGFLVVEALAERWKLKWEHKVRWQARFAHKNEIALLEPTTFMNLSGQAVSAFRAKYKLLAQNCLVIADDLDLPFGTVRLRAQGSSGGQKGLLSVEQALRTRSYPRLRIGIGRPLAGESIEAWVLEAWSQKELIELPKIIAQAVEGVLLWLENEIAVAMNLVNHRCLGDKENGKTESL